MKKIVYIEKKIANSITNLLEMVIVKSEKLKGIFIYLIFLLTLLLINVPVVAQIKMLRMGSDEYNILSIAAYIAGIDWSSYNASINAYHGFGSALIYVPLFWIFKDSILIYKMALIENIFILSIVSCISYYIARHFFHIKKFYSIFISLCISVYPYYLISNKHTWSENSVILFTWLNLLLALKLFEKWNTKFAIWWGILYAFVAGYSYMVHGRCIVYAVLAILVTVLCIWLNKDNQNSIKKTTFLLLFFLLTIFVMYFLNIIIINFFKDNLWHADTLRNTMETLAGDRISYFMSWSNIKTMLKLAVGQLFYLVVVTMGLAILAFFICIRNIYWGLKSKTKEKMEIFLSFYILFAYIGSLGISILGLISGVTVGNKRSDYVIWGRHTEPLFPMFIWLVFLYCIIKKLDTKILRYSFYGMLTCVFAFLKVGIPLYLIMDSSGHSSIVSILMWLRWETLSMGNIQVIMRFISISIQIVIISAILLNLLRYKKLIIVGILCVIEFMLSYTYVVNQITLPLAEASYKRVVNVIEFFEQYDVESKTIYYASTEKRYPSELQVALGDKNVVLLYDPINPASVDFSGVDWNDAVILFDSSCLDKYYEQNLINIKELEKAQYITLGDKKLLVWGEINQKALNVQGANLSNMSNE